MNTHYMLARLMHCMLCELNTLNEIKDSHCVMNFYYISIAYYIYYSLKQFPFVIISQLVIIINLKLSFP